MGFDCITHYYYSLIFRDHATEYVTIATFGQYDSVNKLLCKKV